MTKRAFLFAGQGAQKLGMASDLYATYPIVKETFDTASRILGYDLRELISQGSSEVSVMFVIDTVQEKEAVRALYDAFFRNKD